MYNMASNYVDKYPIAYPFIPWYKVELDYSLQSRHAIKFVIRAT